MNVPTLIRTRIQHVRNARRSPDEIRRLQLRKFRRLVAYADRHSPYYNALIARRGIDPAAATPADFPPLTKTELIAHFDDIVTDRRIRRAGIARFLAGSHDPLNLYLGEYYVVHTSGTSGEVGYYLYSKAEWTRGVAHALRINGFRPKRRRMAFFGATGGHYTGVAFAATCRQSILRLIYDVRAYDINAPLGPVLEELTAFRPDILMGYASGFGVLAERQLAGELDIAPTTVQSSGEPITTADRERIERAFGVPVLNVYSCTEHLIMGYGRPEFGGIYLFEDDLVFEPAADHTLVTNLFNRTLPLIRYRMSDVLTPKERGPDPAFPFTLVEEIQGRSEHIPVFTNREGAEDFISPHVINEFLVPGVRRFQLELVSRTECIFRVCLDSSLAGGDRDRTLREVRVRLGDIFGQKGLDNVVRRVEAVDELRTDPRTGKFRLIVPAQADGSVAAPEAVGED